MLRMTLFVILSSINKSVDEVSVKEPRGGAVGPITVPFFDVRGVLMSVPGCLIFHVYLKQDQLRIASLNHLPVNAPGVNSILNTFRRRASA